MLRRRIFIHSFKFLRTHHYNKGVLQRKLKEGDGEETWKKPPESINLYFLVFSKPIKKQETQRVKPPKK